MDPRSDLESRLDELELRYQELGEQIGRPEVYQDLGGPDGWRDRIADELIGKQRGDGSWSNAQPDMKEDDPLIATSFAIEALSRCR